MQIAHRQYRTSRDAEAALHELVKAGDGQWDSTLPRRRGRPARRFRSSTLSTVYGNTKKPGENCNSVDVDSVNALETQSDDEWREL